MNYLVFLIINTILLSNSEQNILRISSNNSWAEVNETITLECSLTVKDNEHIVWQRKYSNLDINVLTIGSDTFISDLRIRPVREHISEYEYKWNLEIRKLRIEDSAVYYCLLNSRNLVGDPIKLNVMSKLSLINKSLGEIPKLIVLECQYDNVLDRKHEQLNWYMGNTRLRNKHGQISIRHRIVQNSTTISRLKINTTNRHFKLQQQQQENNIFKCQYKGLFKTISIDITKNEKKSQLSHEINSFNLLKPKFILFFLNIFLLFN